MNTLHPEKHLYELASIYAAHRGYTINTLSLHIYGGGQRLNSVGNGSPKLTLKTWRDGLVWLDEHWPKDLEWPAHIWRPSCKGFRGMGER